MRSEINALINSGCTTLGSLASPTKRPRLARPTPAKPQANHVFLAMNVELTLLLCGQRLIFLHCLPLDCRHVRVREWSVTRSPTAALLLADTLVGKGQAGASVAGTLPTCARADRRNAICKQVLGVGRLRVSSTTSTVVPEPLAERPCGQVALQVWSLAGRGMLDLRVKPLGAHVAHLALAPPLAEQSEHFLVRQQRRRITAQVPRLRYVNDQIAPTLR